LHDLGHREIGGKTSRRSATFFRATALGIKERRWKNQSRKYNVAVLRQGKSILVTHYSKIFHFFFLKKKI
jgi:hypothetical protein